MANSSKSDRERRSWLELGEAWLRLVSHPCAQTAEQVFQAEVDLKSTQQGSSARN